MEDIKTPSKEEIIKSTNESFDSLIEMLGENSIQKDILLEELFKILLQSSKKMKG